MGTMLHRLLTFTPLFEGDDPGAGPPAPAGDPPVADPPAGDPPSPRTFTQDDVDRIVRAKAEKLLRQELAQYDIESLKDKAQRFDALEEQQKTELERVTEQAAKAEQARQAADARAESILKRSAIVAEAARQGAVDPDAVVALIDSSQITIGDDDRVTGVEDAVKALLDTKTYLVGSRSPGPGDGGPKGDTPAITAESLRQMTPAQVAALDPQVVQQALAAV